MKAKKAEAAEARPAPGESSSVEQLVEQAVSRVLEKHVPALRQDLVRRVLEELPEDIQVSASSDGSPANLLKAVSAIHAGTTQREILRALLDNTVRYAGRAALFVIKSGTATGWQGRGFGHDDDPIKDLALNISSGIADRAMQSRMAFTGKANEMDSEFVSRLGAPKDESVMVLPLVLKEKVAALVYADAGLEGKMDAAALELLVVATSAWLEVVSLRKQAQKDGNSVEPTIERAEAVRPVQAASAPASDPFTAHAPKHAMAAAAAAAAAPAMAPQPEPIAPAPSGEFGHLPADDAEAHRKAQRFSRLLVDEIKLYNQAKVADGRKNRDLYDRLREDIEKSRATYQKRYGTTVAAAGDYFNQELVHSLAEDDIFLMGANFRR
jgi:hypothetical protein